MTQLKRGKTSKKMSRIAKYLFVGTAGTACFATSAPFPFSIKTDLQLKTIDHPSLDET